MTVTTEFNLSLFDFDPTTTNSPLLATLFFFLFAYNTIVVAQHHVFIPLNSIMIHVLKKKIDTVSMICIQQNGA